MGNSYPHIFREHCSRLQNRIGAAIRDISLAYSEMTEEIIRFKTKDDHVNILLVFGMGESALVVVTIEIREETGGAITLPREGGETYLRELAENHRIHVETRYFDELTYERLNYDRYLESVLDEFLGWEKISFRESLHERIEKPHWHLHCIE